MNRLKANDQSSILRRYTKGFSMLEVLIAMLVIMFGVLGAEGIQLGSINNANVAKQKSLATMIVSSMSARMQGNSAFWATNTLGYTVSSTSVTATGCSTACSPLAMATLDMSSWGNDMFNSGLPSAVGVISYTPGSNPAVYTINISWSAKNIGNLNATGTETGAMATGTVGKINYQTSVIIYAGI